MDQITRTKRMREYQAKRRGGRSYLSEMESAQEHARRLEICLAWESGELSEGTAAKLLNMERVVARGFCNDAIARGAGYSNWSQMSEDKK